MEFLLRNGFLHLQTHKTPSVGDALRGSGRKKEKEKGRKLGNSKKGKRKEGWVKNFELGDKRIISRENKNQ